MNEERRFRKECLEEFAVGVMEGLGVSQEDARRIAGALIHADLLGVITHGIRLFPHHKAYVRGIQAGVINPRPCLQAVANQGPVALLDGDRGMGPLIATRAMEMAVEKARQTGIGIVAVKGMRHFGMAGHYSLLAAGENMVGLTMQNSTPVMVPAGGRKAMLGTNPMAIAAPAGTEPTFLLDMATSAVAGKKVTLAEERGETIPLGWILNAEGRDSSDPGDFARGGAMLPLGSRPELSYHKGYGLGLVVDILCGVLTGMGSGHMIRETKRSGGFFAALNIEFFRPLEDFKVMMDEMIRDLRGTPPAPGIEGVMVPGEKEYRTKQDRLENGIPLDQKTIGLLQALGEELGVPFKA